MVDMSTLQKEIQTLGSDLGALDITIKKLAQEVNIDPTLSSLESEINRVKEKVNRLLIERQRKEKKILKKYRALKDNDDV